MDIKDKNNSFLPLAAVIFGMVLGGVLVGAHTQAQINSLEQSIENLEQGNVVNLNHTEDSSLTQLFRQVEGSAVSIRAYGADQAQGSGFVYDDEGHIVTNEHVIDGAERVEVTFTDGTRQDAEVIGTDPFTDLAVLEVDNTDLEPLELADSEQVQVGQRAVALGNPFGLQSSMTSGIISQKERTIRIERGFSIPNILQTDASINPGNSGGPLMNINGEVVGVNTAIESRTGTFSGVGFAVPSNTVERVVPEIIEDQDYEHSWIGVRGIDVSPEIAEEMDLEEASGFMIIDVVEDGPADLAGLRGGETEAEIEGEPTRIGGDVITAIDGERMRGIDDILVYLARETEPGDQIEVTAIRDGEEQNFDLTLQSRPEE